MLRQSKKTSAPPFRKADNPYIRSVHWSITGRCNLKCRHCYMESPDGRYGELPLVDILHIIGQLAAANVHLVELTGGELHCSHVNVDTGEQ